MNWVILSGINKVIIKSNNNNNKCGRRKKDDLMCAIETESAA